MAENDQKNSDSGATKVGVPVTSDTKNKKFISGMEHLADSEEVTVRVNSPSYTRLDPETGKVKRYRRGTELTITRMELQTSKVNGIRTAPLVEVEEDENK